METRTNDKQSIGKYQGNAIYHIQTVVSRDPMTYRVILGAGLGVILGSDLGSELGSELG